MHLDAVFAGERRNLADLVERHDHPVKSVFEGDHPGRTGVDVRGDDGMFLDVFEREMVAVGRVDGDEHRVGEG